MAAPWEALKGKSVGLSERQWELYDIAEDFSQANDLAATKPAKLAEMKQRFFDEAARTAILPIHHIAEGAGGRPSLAAGRDRFIFHAGMTRIPEDNAPRVAGRSFTISADVVIPQGGANGVLITQGGRFGGYAFYVKDDRLMFHYNAIGERQYPVRSAERLKPGAHRLVAEFSADRLAPGAGGMMSISVDGRIVAKGRIEHTHKGWVSLYEGLDVGEDTLTPVSEDYSVAGSKFGGELKQVTVELR